MKDVVLCSEQGSDGPHVSRCLCMRTCCWMNLTSTMSWLRLLHDCIRSVPGRFTVCCCMSSVSAMMCLCLLHHCIKSAVGVLQPETRLV